MKTQLTARGLGLWRGERRLCEELSFVVEAGSILQLAGPNGSGKTSLLRVIAGIGRLDEGGIQWDGEPVRSSRYRDNLLYLGHQNGLKNHLSATENYNFYQSVTGYTSEIRASEALSRCGLEGLVDRPVALLSMGQRRRAALARLLAVRAKLWLLDEPLTSLDSDGITLVTGLLNAHLSNGGMAILATHQPLAVEGAPLQRLELGSRP